MTHHTLSKPTATPKMTDRQQQLTAWLQQVFPNQAFSLDSLVGDASARHYHRMQLSNDKDMHDNTAPRYIVMDSADEQAAMRQFITVATLMAPAINVPTLVAQDVAQGFLVLQDFGAVEFAHLLQDATPSQVNRYYQWAMQTLVSLQKIDPKSAKSQYQLPDYDTALLAREMDLFRDWFLPYIGATLEVNIWNNFKSVLMTEILAQPQVVVHRDYHSRNLMQDQADNSRLGVIDFQDAVIGAYSYDVVSLVRDAYVDWSEAQVSQWIQDFWQLQNQAGISTADSAQQFEHDVNVMGVQRHLKVLGIFIRLSKRDGKDRYLADIPKVMSDLMFELEWLEIQGNTDVRQALAPFNAWIQGYVLPAYQRTFAQQYI